MAISFCTISEREMASYRRDLPTRPNKLRTAPLWGLHIKSRYMHDLASLTLEDAIERHRHEADHVRHALKQMSETEQQELITFLKSL